MSTIPRLARACAGGELVPGLSPETSSLLAERLGTVHVELTNHPLSTDPGLYSGDGRHGNARSDAIATAATLRILQKHLEMHVK